MVVRRWLYGVIWICDLETTSDSLVPRRFNALVLMLLWARQVDTVIIGAEDADSRYNRAKFTGQETDG